MYSIARGTICSSAVSAIKIIPQHEKSIACLSTTSTVPAYLQILGSLSGLLTKAEAHCKAKNIQPEVLLGSRLYPDMLPLSRQIQLATDFATRGCARVTHSEVPQTPDTEKTFEDLRQRLAKTIDYVKSFKPAQFEGADTKDVTFPMGRTKP